MINRLKKIERELMGIYAEIQKEIPAIHCLSFSVSQTNKNSKPYLYGFFHIGTDCEPYNNISELAALVTEVKKRRAKNEILYYDFKGVL